MGDCSPLVPTVPRNKSQSPVLTVPRSPAFRRGTVTVTVGGLGDAVELTPPGNGQHALLGAMSTFVGEEDPGR